MPAQRPIIGVTCSTMDAVEGRGVRRFHVPEPYVRCVEAAGGFPILLPISDPRSAGAYLSLVHGLLLIGGDDVDPALYGAAPHVELGPVDRARDDFEIALARTAADRSAPTLGICRGLQVMNVAFGGTLHQHIPASVPNALAHSGRYDEAHAISVAPSTRLSRILGALDWPVNSHHHQAAERVAKRLVVSARSPDGVIEAAEDPSHPFLVGVQWHPERMSDSEATLRLFAAFVAAAREFAGKQAPALVV